MKQFQALLFIPVIVSMVPSTLMWKMLFDYNFGVINFILETVGIKSINWINNDAIVKWPIVIIGVWKEIGYNMLIFYVGLKAIPKEFFESADMDGSSRSQKMWYITLPQLKPITLFVCVMSLIKFVKIFTQAFVMTSGSQSSGKIFKTLVYYIYQQGFQLQSMGRASAASVILLILVFLLTLLQMRLSREK
jgi:ABC-type sugar transport system permease subunit